MKDTHKSVLLFMVVRTKLLAGKADGSWEPSERKLHSNKGTDATHVELIETTEWDNFITLQPPMVVTRVLYARNTLLLRLSPK